MKVPNNNYEIERIFITSNFSFYENLKFFIKQVELVKKEIFQRENGLLTSVSSFCSRISHKTIFVNTDLIDFYNTDNYEIQRQFQEEQYDADKPELNHNIINLTYEHEQLNSVFQTQFIKWWENGIREKINLKYENLNKANSICQFARQIRNAFGHSKINIELSRSADDPIWKELNLKNHNGEDIFKVLSLADLINFWIEFENIELNN